MKLCFTKLARAVFHNPQFFILQFKQYFSFLHVKNQSFLFFRCQMWRLSWLLQTSLTKGKGPSAAFFIHTLHGKRYMQPTYLTFFNKIMLQKCCNKIKLVWLCCRDCTTLFCYFNIKKYFCSIIPSWPTCVAYICNSFQFLWYNKMSSHEERDNLNDDNNN